jgi:uncharacterized protein YecT (DUF1311 family)
MNSKIKYLPTLLMALILTTNSLFGQTQGQMNKESGTNYKKVDTELGIVYQKVIKEYVNNPEFIEALRASERIWIQFRDAEVKMKYPAMNPRLEYGSMYPLCVNAYLEVLTQNRINELKKWLIGIKEGEGCNGSIKSIN